MTPAWIRAATVLEKAGRIEAMLQGLRSLPLASSADFQSDQRNPTQGGRRGFGPGPGAGSGPGGAHAGAWRPTDSGQRGSPDAPHEPGADRLGRNVKTQERILDPEFAEPAPVLQVLGVDDICSAGERSLDVDAGVGLELVPHHGVHGGAFGCRPYPPLFRGINLGLGLGLEAAAVDELDFGVRERLGEAERRKSERTRSRNSVSPR